MKNEMVLVVRRSLIESIGSFQGLNFAVDRYFPAMLARENNFFVPRTAAETDPSLKQIIPYALIVSAGRVLRYRRGKKTGEQRLAAKGSIGIGGHLNDHDEGLFTWDHAAYLAGVQREIDEEIKMAPALQNRVVALLNDDSNEVGQVHLGVVHRIELPEPVAQKRESTITQVEFLTPAALREERDSLETWSQICLDHLDHLLATR